DFHRCGGNFVCYRQALLWIVNVVAIGVAYLLAEDPAGGVYVRRGLINAILHLSSGRRTWPCNRPANAEFDLGSGSTRGCDRDTQREAERSDLFHLYSPSN